MYPLDEKWAVSLVSKYMQYFWVIIVSIILLLITWGIVSSSFRYQRLKQTRESLLPIIPQHFQAGHLYTVFLSSGQKFERVRFLGTSPEYDQPYGSLPFPLCQWIVLERENGKLLYVKPESIRYYEDS